MGFSPVLGTSRGRMVLLARRGVLIEEKDLVNSSQEAPGEKSPAGAPEATFKQVMTGVLDHAERLDVYDEPAGAPPVLPPLLPAHEDSGPHPEAARRDPGEARPLLAARATPWRSFSVFLAGMLTGGVFLALGFWAGQRARVSLAPAHPAQVTPSSKTGASPQGLKGVAPTENATGNVSSLEAPATSEKSNPAPPAQNAAAASAAKLDTGFEVQVASPSTRQEADDLARILTGMGYPVLPAVAARSGSPKLFRVRVGPFPTREEADRVVVRLRIEGFKSSELVGQNVPSMPSVKE